MEIVQPIYRLIFVKAIQEYDTRIVTRSIKHQTSATVSLVQANVKDLPKSPNLINSIELSTLHGSFQTFFANAQEASSCHEKSTSKDVIYRVKTTQVSSLVYFTANS